MKRTSTSTASRLAALAGVSAVIVTAGAFPAAAASDDGVQVVNTETVQAYTDATGKVKSKRIYEQLALTGNGEVDLANPITTSGLRNLDGFGGFKVKGGDQMVDVKVDGEKNLRSVSDYKGDLPLEISVAYKLDGKSISPKSLVGKSGDLEVLYTVKNVTGRSQTISFTDGQGGTVEKTADVIVPMVGSLTVGLPSTFRDVKSGEANMAGDGEGGTKLSFTMTLLAPLGSDTATFGYTAKVVDAIAPDASVSALPVNPLESPSFKTAGESYKGGAATGEELAAGAATIDTNLLKLRDGAGDLLAGLIKLRNGARQLSDGLQNEAAPGAAKLADGAGQLNDGTGQLRDGTGQLTAGTGKLQAGAGELNAGAGKLDAGANKLDAGANKLDAGANKLDAGAGKLAAGTGDAAAGAKALTDGLAQISGGLDTLSGAEGLGKAAAGVTALQQGVATILAGFGQAGQEGTLIDGLTQLSGGLGLLEDGQGKVVGGLQQLTAPAGLPAAKGGVDQVKAGLDAAVAPGGDLDKLAGGIAVLKTYCDYAPAGVDQLTCKGTADALITGITAPIDAATPGSKAKLTAARDGLIQVSGGLGTAIGGLTSQLIPGAIQVRDGLTSAKAGSGKALAGAQQLKGGVQQVSAGLDQLSVGLTAAVDGVLKLANGAGTAYTGSQTLSGGLGQLDAGAKQLAAGTGELSAGTGELSAGTGTLSAGTGDLLAGTARLAAGVVELATGANKLNDGAVKLDDGAGQLDAGANKLADGLSAAAGGSGQLADGLETAAAGAPKLVDGAQRLSTEGTSKLVEAGQDTAQKYGEQYALLVAGAKRAQDEKMVVGAPADSVGLAAYSFEVKGEDGEGGRNLMRGVAGLALLGAGGAVFALRRRLI